MTSVDDPGLVQAVEFVGRVIGGAVTSTEPIRTGGNNRILKVNRRGQSPVLVKLYFRHPADPRDRLATEFGALSFLWRHGVRLTPEPLAADHQLGLAAYGFVEGSRIDPDGVGKSEIAAVVALLKLLQGLCGAAGAATIGPASEACFSVESLLTNLRKRFDRHIGVTGGEPQYAAYGRFRDGPLKAALAVVESELIERARRAGEPIGRELPAAKRILSPSDLGFHNALRLPAGGVVFLDFEYFGWDDPAKTICDFCYHPAMMLSEGMKKRFVASVLEALNWPDLGSRVDSVLPAYGLKWCLIVLNEFLPEGRQRRMLARGQGGSIETMLEGQLAKAHDLLERVTKGHGLDGILGTTP